jgi:hypothetical protein
MWDDDIRPAPGCLAAYVKAMQQHPEVSAVDTFDMHTTSQ